MTNSQLITQFIEITLTGRVQADILQKAITLRNTIERNEGELAKGLKAMNKYNEVEAI